MVEANAHEVSFEEVMHFPPVQEIQDHHLYSLSLRNKTNQYTHGLHRFPAKYIPQVAEWAIENYAEKNSLILDPFAGSGTTLVEAIRNGHNAVGQEINPLARLISRVKSTPLSPEKLIAISRHIMNNTEIKSGPLVPPIEGVRNFDHWFTITAWRDLQLLKHSIMTTPMEEPQKEFFLTVFSSILRWVSNADDQTQKTYVSGTRPKVPPRVFPTWEKRVRAAIQGMAQLVTSGQPIGHSSVPSNGDATKITCADESIDLAVTSPPYVDSVDYPYNLMLEHFWLGPELGIPTRKEFNKLRNQQMGAKHPLIQTTLPQGLKKRLRSIEFASQRDIAMVNYFSLMDKHLSEMARVLKPDAKYVMVIGNSRTVNNTIPIHESVVDLARNRGLIVEHSFGYRVRRHYMKFPRAGRGGIILIDWVLTFSKNPSRQVLELEDLPSFTIQPHEVAN